MHVGGGICIVEVLVYNRERQLGLRPITVESYPSYMREMDTIYRMGKFGDDTKLENKSEIVTTLFAYGNFYGKECEEAYEFQRCQLRSK